MARPISPTTTRPPMMLTMVGYTFTGLYLLFGG
jgi:hypothetical protein